MNKITPPGRLRNARYRKGQNLVAKGFVSEEFRGATRDGAPCVLRAQRFGAVEPAVGNVRYTKGLERFTLRGRTKVDGQWKLFCLVHNIEKLANNGYAA